MQFLHFFLKSTTWLMLACLTLIFYLIFGGAAYINCIQPIKGYINIFRASNHKIVKRNILFFFLFPIFLSIATVLNTLLNDSIINVICLMISVLTAMLYSFMAILSSKKDYLNCNEEISANTYDRQKVLQQETIDIIAYEILISILILILCFVHPIFSSIDIGKDLGHIISQINSFLVFSLLYNFLLNLLIISKRFYCILKI